MNAECMCPSTMRVTKHVVTTFGVISFFQRGFSFSLVGVFYRDIWMIVDLLNKTKMMKRGKRIIKRCAWLSFGMVQANKSVSVRVNVPMTHGPRRKLKRVFIAKQTPSVWSYYRQLAYPALQATPEDENVYLIDLTLFDT